MKPTPDNLAAAERWERFLANAARVHPRPFVREHGAKAAARLQRVREAHLNTAPELDLNARRDDQVTSLAKQAEALREEAAALEAAAASLKTRSAA